MFQPYDRSNYDLANIGAKPRRAVQALLGIEKVLDLEPPDDLHRKPSLDVDLLGIRRAGPQGTGTEKLQMA